MAEFQGKRGVWATYEMGNEHEDILTVADTERDAILDVRDHGTHDTKIIFWPFGITFKDAIEKWRNRDG